MPKCFPRRFSESRSPSRQCFRQAYRARVPGSNYAITRDVLDMRATGFFSRYNRHNRGEVFRVWLQTSVTMQGGVEKTCFAGELS